MTRHLDLVRRGLLAMEADEFRHGMALRIQGERDAVDAVYVYFRQHEHLIDALHDDVSDSKDPWYIP